MRRTRLAIVIVTLILISIGIVMIYSSSSIYAKEVFGDGMFFLKRHLVFLFIGLLCCLVTMSFDYRILKKWAKPILLFSYFLLILVLIPGMGTKIAGARRWFRFGVISFQPSELANLALIIYIADFISRKKNLIRDSLNKGFLIPLSVLGIGLLLILAQPDLGSCFALAVVIMFMLFIAGARIKHLAGIVGLAMPILYVLIFSVPYRRARIMAFINPWLDPEGSGFQIIQSNVALGSGGIFGLGLGHSRQKLFYLPAAHTDFVFSIIGEELGLLGTIGICILFMVLIIQGIKIIRNAQDIFGYYLSSGIILLIILKAAINIGVSTGIFPTKGLPLPFISYGGTALVLDMISIALLLNIARFEEG
jgi:cell division protein FtsW